MRGGPCGSVGVVVHQEGCGERPPVRDAVGGRRDVQLGPGDVGRLVGGSVSRGHLGGQPDRLQHPVAEEDDQPRVDVRRVGSGRQGERRVRAVSDDREEDLLALGDGQQVRFGEDDRELVGPVGAERLLGEGFGSGQPLVQAGSADVDLDRVVGRRAGRRTGVRRGWSSALMRALIRRAAVARSTRSPARVLEPAQVGGVAGLAEERALRGHVREPSGQVALRRGEADVGTGRLGGRDALQAAGEPGCTLVSGLGRDHLGIGGQHAWAAGGPVEGPVQWLRVRDLLDEPDDERARRRSPGSRRPRRR